MRLIKTNKKKMNLKSVKETIYEFINREYEMGLPPQESWEGLQYEFEDATEEEIKYIINDLFDEVFDKWENDNPNY